MHSKVDILREKILSDIRSGRLAQGRAIPSRFQFMKRYSCSRGTVDKAVSGLVDDGYIYCRQGAGSYVGEPSGAAAVRQVFVAGNCGAGAAADPEIANLASELQKHLPCFLHDTDDMKNNLGRIARPGNAVIWIRPPYEQLMTMKHLQNANVPQLLIGRSYSGFDHIVTDAREGIRLGLQWLSVNAGSDLTFITPENNPDSPFIAERRIAFYELCLELGLKVEHANIFQMKFADLKKDVRFLSENIFAGKKRMKAIFTTYISAAFPIVSMAESRGWRAGKDFFLLTFDDEPNLHGHHGIGMLRQMWDEMGDKSVEWIMRKLKNRNEEFKIKITPKLLTWDRKK